MGMKEFFKKRRLKRIEKNLNTLIEEKKKLSNQTELNSFSSDSLIEDLSKTSDRCKGCGKVFVIKKGNELHKLGVCSKRCRVLYVTNSINLLFNSDKVISDEVSDLFSYIDDIFKRLNHIENTDKRIISYLIKCRKKQKKIR
jgi:hypothetical protein